MANAAKSLLAMSLSGEASCSTSKTPDIPVVIVAKPLKSTKGKRTTKIDNRISTNCADNNSDAPSRTNCAMTQLASPTASSKIACPDVSYGPAVPVTHSQDDDLAIIKAQLTQLIPVVAEIKSAYDAFNQSEEEGEGDTDEVTLGSDSDQTGTAAIAGQSDNSSIEYFKGVAGTIVSAGPIINDDIATGVSNILQSGMDSGNRDRFSTSGHN